MKIYQPGGTVPDFPIGSYSGFAWFRTQQPHPFIEHAPPPPRIRVWRIVPRRVVPFFKTRRRLRRLLCFRDDISIPSLEMKVQRFLAIVLVCVALLLTAVGGFMDSWRGGSTFVLTARHAWHDGMFLLGLAVVLLLL